MAYMTITAANSVFTLVIAGLFNTPQQLEGYSADQAFTAESITPVEVVMGVDGNMSAGWLPVEKKQTILIMPDSPSASIFDNWYSAQEAARELYFASGEVVLPATNNVYTLTKGVLSQYTPIPEVGKVLKARSFGLTWMSILPSPT